MRYVDGKLRVKPSAKAWSDLDPATRYRYLAICEPAAYELARARALAGAGRHDDAQAAIRNAEALAE